MCCFMYSELLKRAVQFPFSPLFRYEINEEKRTRVYNGMVVDDGLVLFLLLVFLCAFLMNGE